MFFHHIILAFTLIFIGASVEAYDIVNDTRDRQSVERILAFGDSQTAGVALYDDSYPFQLSKLIGLPVDNLAVNGLRAVEASAEGYIENVLRQFPNPDVVMMTLTGNDLQSFQNKEDVFRNLERVFKTFQANGAMVVMLATDINGNADTFGGWQAFGLRILYGDYYDRLIALSAQNGVLVVPKALEGIWGNDKLLMRNNGGRDPVHPNFDGHKLVAQRVADVLIPYLPNVSAVVPQAELTSRKPMQYHEGMGSGPIPSCGDASLAGFPVVYSPLNEGCVLKGESANSVIYYWVEAPESGDYIVSLSVAGGGDNRYLSVYTGSDQYLGRVKAPSAGLENFSDRPIREPINLNKGWNRIGIKFEQAGIDMRYIDLLQ